MVTSGRAANGIESSFRSGLVLSAGTASSIENEVDESVCSAEIVFRLEKARDMALGKDGGDVGVLGEHGTQVPLLGLRTAASRFDQLVRRSAIKFFAKSHGNSFGVD